MKALKIILTLILFLSHGILLSQTSDKSVFTGCATDVLMRQDPSLLQLQKTLDETAYKYFLEKNKTGQRTNSVIEYIPVVVHIIHNGGPENISNSQVQTAIANINAKYLQSNGNQIQFCLAQRDPQGNATIGITRDVSVLTTETMELDDVTLKNINRWNPACYLNIWVVKEILSISMGSGVIGYGFFPSAYGTNIDGVVIEAGYFGSSPANDAVGAHEIGHYFGLYHTFQNGCVNNNCLQDGDQVCDTPPDQTTFASCNPATNSCNTDADDPSANNPFTTDVADLSDDYMDYSALSCYNQFTTGQYDRMQFFLTTVRSSLLGCLSCTPPCPTPVIASITLPTAISNVTIGTVVNFSGTATNASSYQWYINSSNIFSTNSNATYTFNTPGSYWVKFLAISSNPSSCTNGIDSILINVAQPTIASCAGSLLFLHPSDAVDLPTPSSNQYYSSNGFTWECWVKLAAPFSSYTSSNNFRPIICSIDPIVYEDICLSFGWVGGVGNVPLTHLAFKVDGPNSSTGPSPVSCDYALPGGFLLGTWYHVAGTMDYSTHTSKLYLNGALVDTKTVNSAPFSRIIPSQLSWDNALNPGYSNLPLGGNMDEVRIWSEVRTPTEIATYYNQCLTGNEPNLLLYYRCNQSAGTIAQDATTNGNNGTLVNTASWSTDQPTLVGSNCSIGCAVECPPIKASNDTTICFGSSAQINSSIGFSTYTWTPSTGLNNSNIRNPLASPVITTTYIVTGDTLDANNQPCTSTDTVVVKVVHRTIPVLNLGNDIAICASSIHTFNAGPGFYSYHWYDGGTDQTNTVYGIGKYWVTVTDSCGGIQSDTVLVTLAPTPPLNLIQDTTLCSSDSLLLSFTPVGVYNTYQWTPTVGLSCVHCANPFAKPLVSTKYYLVASTPAGCTTMDSITLTIANSPTLTTTNYTVCSRQSLTIIPTVIGGTGGYTYNWGSGYNGSSYTTTPVADSIYTISVTDANGCFTPVSTGSITVLAPLQINVNSISTCISVDTVHLLATALGGTGNYIYTWTPSNSHQNPLLILPQNTITYTVSVSDGCNNLSDTAQVIITPAPLISLPQSISGCRPVCLNLDNIPYDTLSAWKWNFGDGSFLTIQQPFHCYSKTGTYNVSLTYTTTLGCVKTVSSNSLVVVFSSPDAAFAASTFETDIFNPDINFYNESSGYTNSQWFFGDLASSNLTNPSHLYTSVGNYPVTLIVQNQKGCKDTVIHEVIINDVFTFYAPNTFTPNEDNYNETFLPVGTGWDNSSFKMLIFDRWGNEVLNTTNPNQGWDGKVKGQYAQQDVYVWKVELKDVFQKNHSYSGTITIIK